MTFMYDVLHERPIYCAEQTMGYKTQGDYHLPEVTHKAVAEFQKEENYRRDWLLWVTDVRAKTLTNWLTSSLTNWLIDQLMNWVIA